MKTGRVPVGEVAATTGVSEMRHGANVFATFAMKLSRCKLLVGHDGVLRQQRPPADPGKRFEWAKRQRIDKPPLATAMERISGLSITTHNQVEKDKTGYQWIATSSTSDKLILLLIQVPLPSNFSF